ncbi:MAG TPA: hypothetical protein VF389_06335, partial [Woeseiaceae bacterium]
MTNRQIEKGMRSSPVLISPAETESLRVDPGERNMGESAIVYEELDHRLMATFPASDATARY